MKALWWPTGRQDIPEGIKVKKEVFLAWLFSGSPEVADQMAERAVALLGAKAKTQEWE